MATFLDRALDLPSTAEDFFYDDEGSPHERAINRVAGRRHHHRVRVGQLLS